MKWGRRKLKKLDDNIFFVGCGEGEKTDCIGKDFAVLSKCNHTILTHGTYGHWVSLIHVAFYCILSYILPNYGNDLKY